MQDGPSAQDAPSHLISIGEVLWDSLPEGLFLGGATLNVAYHLNALGHLTYLASAVGDDFLGTEVRTRLQRLGMADFGIATHAELPTGFVRVDFGDGGEGRTESESGPRYEILQPVAWDDIPLVPRIRELAATAKAIVFGTLAQRSPTSRESIRALWAEQALKVCDVNLRPPFVDQEVVRASLQAANLVKLNEAELETIAGWERFHSPAASSARSRSWMELAAALYDIETLCVTRGAGGAMLLCGGKHYEHPGFRVTPLDTVGSGDAFLAGLLDARLRGEPVEAWLERANRCGAYVATQGGGTPPVDEDALASVGG